MRRVLRKRFLLLLASITVVSAGVMLLPPPSPRAADHGDAPLTAHDLGADLNDV